MTAHYVYRCFDSEGRLVYVGQTKDVAARLQQHQRAFWSPMVVKVKASTHRNPQIARAIERRAIREEHPRFNLQGRWGVIHTWPEQAFDDFLLMLANGDINTPTSRWRGGQIRQTLTAYRQRFGTDHRLHDHLIHAVEALRAEWQAANDASRAEHLEQSRLLALQDAADRAAHNRVCCACRFGIFVDDELVEKYGGQLDDDGLLIEARP